MVDRFEKIVLQVAGIRPLDWGRHRFMLDRFVDSPHREACQNDTERPPPTRFRVIGRNGKNLFQMHQARKYSPEDGK
jgi:hypothetical protein